MMEGAGRGGGRHLAARDVISSGRQNAFVIKQRNAPKSSPRGAKSNDKGEMCKGEGEGGEGEAECSQLRWHYKWNWKSAQPQPQRASRTHANHRQPVSR